MAASGFGDLLRGFRIAAGLTQEELAERAGVSTRGISDLERGARGLPRNDTLQLLLHALDLSEADRAALTAAARHRPAIAPRPNPGRHASILPAPLMPLIGREGEIAAVRALLGDPALRLLTLIGPGGTGKTRLALAVAEQAAPAFPGGVIFVDLAPLRDPAFVVSAIARQMGVREGSGQSLVDRLQAHLGAKRLLLVLDNFEHLLPAARLVAELLVACRSLTVLVTSRAVLHLSGEQAYPVPPLALPHPAHRPPLDELRQIAAVRFFVDRVHAVKPSFALTEDNALAVAAIVRNLDGLPLALELAAARVAILSPAELLARLDHRLPLLTGGAQDLPDRQRTLRQTIAWSYDLLSPQERALFRRLAVFAGGWTLEAAEIVANRDDGLAVLEGMASLVEKSLVRPDDQATGSSRFTMLETVREFGLEQLAMSGEDAVLGAQHAAWSLVLAEQADAALFGRTDLEWVDQLSTEHDNLRAALTWSHETDAVETSLRLSGALWWFWFLQGDWSEGRRWLERSLVRSRDAAAARRAKALIGVATLAHHQGDQAQAVQATQESLTLWRQDGNEFGTGYALLLLAVMAEDHGDYEAAVPLIEEALVLFHEAGHEPLASLALHHLGVEAEGLGDYARATARFKEALRLSRELGDAWNSATNLVHLGLVAMEQGAYTRSAGCLADSLVLFPEIGKTEVLAQSLAGVAALAAKCQQPKRAAEFFGMAEALGDVLGYRFALPERATYERALGAVQAELGEPAFSAARAQGRTTAPDQAVTEATELLTRIGVAYIQ